MADATIGLNTRLETRAAQTALNQFMVGLMGGQKALKAYETNVYAATRAGTLFSAKLITEPIATLKAFTAQTNKAAIAAEYFKGQLQFIAASRFGQIVIWGAVIGTVTQAILKAFSASMELEKATQHVRSAFIGAEREAQQYLEVQDRIVIASLRYGQSYENIGKILWELKSAGLSAQDAVAGLDTNQKLVVAGVSDLEQSTRLTAAIFRVYGDSIKDATTSTEKFRRIGDTLAYVLNKSQVDMDGLVQGFKYVISTGELAGFTFNQTAAYLSTLNNRMLFGTTAGTSLVNAFIQLSKNLDKIQAKFQLKIDPQKSLGSQFDSILAQMQKRFQGTNFTVEQLGDLFESLNIRGGRAMAALIKGGTETNNTLALLNRYVGEVQGSLDKITETKMDTLAAQWERLKKAMEGISSGVISPIRDELKDIARYISDATEMFKTLSFIVGKNVSPEIKSFLSMMASFIAVNPFEKVTDAYSMLYEKLTGKSLKTQWNEAVKSVRDYNDTLDDTPKIIADVVNQYATLHPEVNKYEKTLLELKELQDKFFKDVPNSALTRIVQTFHDFESTADVVNKVSFVSFKQSLDETDMKGKQLLLTIKGIANEGGETSKVLRDFSKDFTLAEKLQFAITHFKEADAALKIIGVDTKDIETKLNKVNNASDAFIKAWVNANNSVKAVASSMSALTSIVTSMGGGREAEQLLMDQYRELEVLKMSAKTEEEKLELTKQQGNILSTMQKEQIGFWGGNVAQQITENAKEQFGYQKKIVEEKRKEAEEAQKLIQSDEVLDIPKRALEIYKNWREQIEKSNVALGEGMKSGFQSVEENLKTITGKFMPLLQEQLDNMQGKFAKFMFGSSMSDDEIINRILDKLGSLGKRGDY